MIRIISLAVALLISLPLATKPVNAMELESIDGDKNILDKLHKSNMWTLVLVWSLDCIACEKQKPMLEQFHKDHRLSNAQVVGIVSDGDKHTQAIKNRIRGNALSFNSYIPKTNSFDSEFLKLAQSEFIGTPTYLLFKPGGAFAGSHAGIVQRVQLEKIVGPATNLQTPSVDLIR